MEKNVLEKMEQVEDVLACDDSSMEEIFEVYKLLWFKKASGSPYSPPLSPKYNQAALDTIKGILSEESIYYSAKQEFSNFFEDLAKGYKEQPWLYVCDFVELLMEGIKESIELYKYHEDTLEDLTGKLMELQHFHRKFLFMSYKVSGEKTEQ